MEYITVYSSDEKIYSVKNKESEVLDQLFFVQQDINKDDKIILPIESNILDKILNFQIITDPYSIIEIVHSIDFLNMNTSKINIYKMFSIDAMNKALSIMKNNNIELYYPKYYLTNCLILIEVIKNSDNSTIWTDDFFEFIFIISEHDEIVRMYCELNSDYIMQNFKTINLKCPNYLKYINLFKKNKYSDRNIEDSIYYNVANKIINNHYLDNLNYILVLDTFTNMYISKLCTVLVKSEENEENIFRFSEIIKYIDKYNINENDFLKKIAYASNNNKIKYLDILKKSKFFKCTEKSIDGIEYTRNNYSNLLLTLEWWINSNTNIVYNVFIKSKINKRYKEILYDIKKIDKNNIFTEINYYLISNIFVKNNISEINVHKCCEKCDIDFNIVKYIPSIVIENNCINLLKKCIENNVTFNIDNKIIKNASINSSADTLNYLIEEHICPINLDGIIDELSYNGNIYMLEWWKNKPQYEFIYTEKSIDECYDNIECLNWWINSKLKLKYSNLCMIYDINLNKSKNMDFLVKNGLCNNFTAIKEYTHKRKRHIIFNDNIEDDIYYTRSNIFYEESDGEAF